MAEQAELVPVETSETAAHDGAVAMRPDYDIDELTFSQRVALDPTVDIERLRAIIDMEQSSQDRAAEKEFESAFVQMQSRLPAVAKRGEGQSKTAFAKLEDIQAAVRPVLIEHGFGFRFKVTDQESALDVTCILSHTNGHKDTDTIRLPYDAGGQKNNTQARGSSVSYGKRYTLCNILGIQLGGEDNDGGKPLSGDTLTEHQVKAIRDKLETLGRGEDMFLQWAGQNGLGATELEAIAIENFDRLIGQLDHWLKVSEASNG